MGWYLAIPLLAGLVATFVATRTWAREPDNPRIWPIVALAAISK